jgi:hypothetical protein
MRYMEMRYMENDFDKLFDPNKLVEGSESYIFSL